VRAEPAHLRVAEVDTPAISPPRAGARAWKFFALGSALALAVVLALLGFLHPWGRSSPTIRSLAVLPLENLSGDPSQDYFADGITEELITDLGQIGALRVISRTSVMSYKNVRKSMADIARELNVEAVVEGSVLRSGDRVRITAQLIRAPADQHIWAKSYEADFRDTLTLQRNVARDIAEQVRATVDRQEQTALEQSRPVIPEAYEPTSRDAISGTSGRRRV
jgi:TolB-like protein